MRVRVRVKVRVRVRIRVRIRVRVRVRVTQVLDNSSATGIFRFIFYTLDFKDCFS